MNLAGEFIKFHNLKEHDMFIVYEDGCKKLVSFWMILIRLYIPLIPMLIDNENQLSLECHCNAASY